ncbi:MAG: NAD(P)/FAD-dependent oxidoreductase [Clostridia bacterium]
MKYDIIVVGAGPAGICSDIYAMRAGKKVLILEKEVIGGKVSSSAIIENYPGIEEIRGAELSDKLWEQVKKLGGEIKIEEVIHIKEIGEEKEVVTKKNNYMCDVVILALGTKYRRLGLENEEKFIGKGLSFCAVCDGFFYKDKIVAVVGGGNSAISNAIELSQVCKKVYVLQNLNYLTGEAILIKQLEEKENVEIKYHTTVKRLLGEERLNSIEVEENGKIEILEIDGMFVSIGQIPETTMVKNEVEMDIEEYIKIDEKGRTSKEGIFSAGDCVEKEIRQLTTAVSDGTIAALNAVRYLEDKEKK